MGNNSDSISKYHFLFKLIPPRATFALDMTDEEKKIMKAHAEFWNDLIEKKTALLFGPVLDPHGVWGLAILEVDESFKAAEIASGDPSVVAGVNTFELIPMQVSAVRK